jgi:hypothetical protein
MHEDFAQRRRVAFAVAITVILVPAAFLLNRNGGGEAAVGPSGTLVGPAVLPGDSIPSSLPDDETNEPNVSARTDPMGTTPEDFIRGTVPLQDDDPATIAIPRVGRALRGSASFSRNIDDPTTCQIRDLATIPFSGEVTVTNLDNSRSVRCIASVAGTAPDDAVVLSSEAFLQIGDLTDAPLSVEITW